MPNERGQLRPEQVAQLLEAVKPHRVKLREGHSHMEGYDVRAHLTRIFGFEGWDIEAEPAQLIHERELDTGRKKDSGWPIVRYSCAYRQHLTLVIYDPDGLLVKRVVGQAVGKAENQPSFGDAHDLALKDAETQALKRAAMNLGDQFGLGLYNKKAADGQGGFKAAVKVTLVRMPEAPGAGMETPEVGEEGDDARRAADTAEAPRSEPEERRERAPGDHVTKDDAANLTEIMEGLTRAERDQIKAERTTAGYSIKWGEFTVGTLRWLLMRAQELTEQRGAPYDGLSAADRRALEAAATQARREDAAAQGLTRSSPAVRDAAEDDALSRAAARRAAGGVKLATKQERDTVTAKLAESGDLRIDVEQWAADNGHDLDNLAADSYQPVMSAISHIRRAGALRAQAAARPARTGDRGSAPDPEAARHKLRREQWEAIAQAVEALGAVETWPMVRGELEERGLITAEHDSQQVNALFVVAGAEHDEFLAGMAAQYAEVADEFLGRPYTEPVQAQPSEGGLDDVDF